MSEHEAQASHDSGSELSTACPSCHFANLTGSRYCAQCGVRIGTTSIEELEGPASKRGPAPAQASEIRSHGQRRNAGGAIR